MGFFSKLTGGLSKTRGGFIKQIKEVFSSGKIDDDMLEELEEILISADVGVSTAMEICEKLRENVMEKGISDVEEIMDEIKAIVSEMMAEDAPLDLSQKPSVILIVGVNGVGKTTSIGKIANAYTSMGNKVMIAAADTFRAAAIEQLEVWAERCGSPIVKHQPGSDPAAVVYDAVVSAKARGTDILICDTAGRLHNKKNLMDELSKIQRVLAKEIDGNIETWLVLDATTGQNGVSQAKLFKEAANITGLVLTKLDGTAKGGIVVAIKKELGIPVRFIGVGEGIDDLQPFSSTEFADALFIKE